MSWWCHDREDDQIRWWLSRDTFSPTVPISPSSHRCTTRTHVSQNKDKYTTTRTLSILFCLTGLYELVFDRVSLLPTANKRCMYFEPYGVFMIVMVRNCKIWFVGPEAWWRLLWDIYNCDIIIVISPKHLFVTSLALILWLGVWFCSYDCQNDHASTDEWKSQESLIHSCERFFLSFMSCCYDRDGSCLGEMTGKKGGGGY